MYKALFKGEDSNLAFKSSISSSGKGINKSSKRMHAESYLRTLVSIYFGETFATKEGANEDGTAKDIKILPYESVQQVFDEYELHCDIHRTHPNERAGFTCFKLAYKSMNECKDGTQIRLLGCKGSFPTCDVCNTSNEMLRDSKRWDSAQRDVVLKFRRLHLKQQQIEREHLENVKAACRTLGKPN